MTDEKRMIGDWEVLQGIHIGDKEVLLLYDPNNTEAQYAACYGEQKLMLESAEGVGGNDYLEMMEEFLHRVQGQIDLVRTEREKTSEPQEVLGKECCLPSYGPDSDLGNRVVVMRPEVLRPEYRNAAHQLVYVTGGFGAFPNSRGSAVYGDYVFSGANTQYRRQHVLGILDPDKAPAWVKPCMEAIQAKFNGKNERNRGDRG